MIKEARPNYWDKIERGLRKVTNLPGSVHTLLGNRDRLRFHQTTPSGADANAKAYVTTEDTNDDGDIETVNIVVTNLEKEWPQELLSKINQMDETDPIFQDVIKGVAKTLIHELAHISDHKDGAFPGGEAVAESQENAFEPVFASSTTNKDNKVNLELKLNAKGEIKMKTELVRLANHLDNIGHSDLADRLDAIVKNATEADISQLTPEDVEAEQNEQTEDVSEDVAAQVTEMVEDAARVASDKAYERINKIASLISGEFSKSSSSVNR